VLDTALFRSKVTGYSDNVNHNVQIMIPLPYSCGCQPTALPVNIVGPPGGAGLAAINAYTTLTQAITLPAIGALVVVPNPPVVGSSAWMALGQFVMIGASATGWAHFQVNSKPSTTTAALTFLGYPGDQAPGTTMAAGSVVSPAGPWGLSDPLTVYGAGTVYAITNAQAAVDMGTTDPSLTITTPGKYLIFSRVKIRNNAAATVPGEVVTINLAKNTVAISGATAAWVCPAVVNGANYFLADLVLPPIVFTTAVATDVVALYAGASAVTNAGAYNVCEAEIVAQRIS
jgi:hypothetical protein